MRQYILLAGICILSACVTRPKPMIAINPQGPVPVGEAKLLDIPNLNPLAKDPDKRPYDLFNDWYEKSFSQASPGSSATGGNRAAVAMMKAGFEYSALLCDSYFNLLANRDQDLGFGIESVGLFGGFASAVLGLTGAPAKSVSLVAAGFATSVAGLESYQQHYHFGPDVSAVRNLITTGQNNYKTAVTSTPTKEIDHFSAILHIKSHQEICQVDSIKALVTAAVERQELTFRTTNRDAFFENTAIAGVQARLETIDEIEVVTTDQVITLYWLMNLSTSDGIRKSIRKDLGPDLASIFLEENGKFKDSSADKRSEVASILRTISPPSLRASIAASAQQKNAQAIANLPVINPDGTTSAPTETELPITTSVTGSLETKM